MRILITGGAGFIGANCAVYFANQGHEIIIFDNLSRMGSEKNLKWIKSKCSIEFIRGDIRSYDDLVDVITQKGSFDLIIHLAAQVAVTTSVANPRDDFEINALGTLNLLEGIRQHNIEATLIYASTNKVYGEMEALNIIEKNGRYTYKDLQRGVDEKRNLDFHSPYGCSKGAADQYCIDYHRIYGLKTIVMRQSCIYGERQFGNEDQGWVAHFLIASFLGRPITIYGDGKQVRDILHVEDLIRAFELAVEHIDVTQGKAYNIGGGPQNSISIWVEFSDIISKLLGREVEVAYGDWRPGDQKIYISNISKAKRDFDWSPKITPILGIGRLYNWIRSNRDLFIG